MKKFFSLLHSLFIKHKYLHFFLTGTSGVAFNLLITWSLTTYYFGLENYFKAYVIGMAFNLFYNFYLHTKITFGTKTRHVTRLVIFILYSLFLTAINASVVNYVTALVGLEYYLFVIAGTIFAFSIFTFLLFKLFLFREKESPDNVVE